MPKRVTPFWRPDPYFRRTALIAVLFVLPSLWVGLQLDDYFHWALANSHAGLPVADLPGSLFDLFGFLDGNPERARELMEKGMLPWWALQDVRYAFWRPVVEFTHALDYLVWPHLPWLMHLHSIVWFVIMLWLAHRLYDLLLGSDAARWATLVFALHYSHGLPVGWLANRNGLMATVFVLLAVLLHHRARGHFSFAALLAFVTALLCGELGVSAGLLLFAYALCLDTRDWRARALSLLPYVAVGVVWLVLRKLFGYGAQGSGHYLDPVHDFSGFITAMVTRGADLLNGQFLLMPPEMAGMLLPTPVRLGIAAVVLVFLLAYGTVLVKQSPVARFFVVGSVLCLLPVAATTPHSRLLLCVSIGGCGLMGMWLAHWRGRDRVGQGGTIRKGLAILLVGAFCVVSPVLLAIESVSMRLFMDGLINRAALSLQWPYTPAVQPPSAPSPESPERANSAPGSSVPMPPAEAPSVAEPRLVLVNPPLTTVAGYLSGLRAWHGLAYPQETYSLASGRLPLQIEVIDAYQLRVHAAAGVYEPEQESLLRDPRQALKVGDTVALNDMTVTIEALSADQVPSQVRVSFARPLQDPGYRFMIWNRGAPAACEWPAPGRSITLTLESASCADEEQGQAP